VLGATKICQSLVCQKEGQNKSARGIGGKKRAVKNSSDKKRKEGEVVLIQGLHGREGGYERPHLRSMRRRSSPYQTESKDRVEMKARTEKVVNGEHEGG